MSKEIPLYYIYEDDSGHRYLIPKDEVSTFYSILDELEEYLGEHADEDIFHNELEMVLESYDRLEGEEYYVVLASDLTGDSV